MPAAPIACSGNYGWGWLQLHFDSWPPLPQNCSKGIPCFDDLTAFVGVHWEEGGIIQGCWGIKYIDLAFIVRRHGKWRDSNITPIARAYSSSKRSCSGSPVLDICCSKNMAKCWLHTMMGEGDSRLTRFFLLRHHDFC